MKSLQHARKSICTTALFLLMSAAFAQTYSNKESSRFSFTAGITSSKLLHDTVGYKQGIGFGGGFIYTIKLSEQLNLGLEALYTCKSLRLESPIIKYRFYYIDVPLYLQYKIGDNFRLNLGGQISAYTNSKAILLDGSNSSGVNVVKTDAVKWTDYSILAGGEFDLLENLALGLRYTVSASTFFQNDQRNFGVFELSFNYAVYRSYRQRGGKTE
jgi:opacity protein-like surface antigen